MPERSKSSSPVMIRPSSVASQSASPVDVPRVPMDQAARRIAGKIRTMSPELDSRTSVRNPPARHRNGPATPRDSSHADWPAFSPDTSVAPPILPGSASPRAISPPGGCRLRAASPSREYQRLDLNDHLRGKSPGASGPGALLKSRQAFVEKPFPPLADDLPPRVEPRGNLIVPQSLCGQEDHPGLLRSARPTDRRARAVTRAAAQWPSRIRPPSRATALPRDCGECSVKPKNASVAARDFWFLARRDDAVWQAPHKEEQRSLSREREGHSSHENHQGPKRPADTRRFRFDGARGTWGTFRCRHKRQTLRPATPP